MNSADMGEIVGPFIGLISAVLVLSIPIIYLVTRARRQQKAMELVHAQRMAAIERGMELPPASLDFGLDERRTKQRTALLPGLMWSLVGLAITIPSALASDDAPPLFLGLIPVAVGVAYLIYYFVEERKVLDHAGAVSASA
jgi:hypothetical protein